MSSILPKADVCGKPGGQKTKAVLLGSGLSSQKFKYQIYPGSQAPFWGEEVTSPAIVGLNTFLVRLCHPIEGLGGLLTNLFWRDG